MATSKLPVQGGLELVEKFLQSFERPNGKLALTLGPWKKYSDRVHQAYILERGDILWVHQSDNSYHGHPLMAKQRRHMVFQGAPTTTADSPSPNAVPVDILSRHKGNIKTSNAATNNIQSTTNREKEQWYEAAPTHLSHLVGKIQIIRTIEEIQMALTEKSQMIIASDGGHDPSSGISSFGWAMAINNVVIAKGRGPVQVAPEMAESFRAEGYGLASACLFAQNLSRKLGINPQQHLWKIVIDSKSLIQRITRYRTHINTPRWNLRPDEDICKVAYQLLPKFPANIIHIKSHQEINDKSRDLHIDITLNNIADNEATLQRNSMSEPARKVDNIGVAQLRIDNMAITRESQRWLLCMAGRIPIQHYYHNRYGWSDRTFNDISWETQWAVL
jgi:hypothetical protein